ncbi:protein of unknown function (plasmid) [Rhodovastum atsumiense]|nr:protein of unknown function [Rhodovastum atsumiense]
MDDIWHQTAPAAQGVADAPLTLRPHEGRFVGAPHIPVVRGMICAMSRSGATAGASRR